MCAPRPQLRLSYQDPLQGSPPSDEKHQEEVGCKGVGGGRPGESEERRARAPKTKDVFAGISEKPWLLFWMERLDS